MKFWFKAKQYGWGWYSASWEGWLVLVVFIVLTVLNFMRIDATSHSVSDTLRPFIIETLGMGLILIFVCWRTGETPRWRWGDKT